MWCRRKYGGHAFHDVGGRATRWKLAYLALVNLRVDIIMLELSLADEVGGGAQDAILIVGDAVREL